jgi:hypothetical protein
MKGILKNTPAGWYVWYSVMRDEITSGYDSIPVYQETFDFNGKQPIIPLVEGKQVEFNIEDFWETGGDEGIKLAKLIIPKEEPKEEPKRETLEEAAERLSELQEGTYTVQHKITYKHGFIDGAKWNESHRKTKQKLNMSSIEWLIEQMRNNIHHTIKIPSDYVEKAKQLHKEEILAAFEEGSDDGFYGWGSSNKEKYYDETFISIQHKKL